ncbi:MAG: MMPL family transporter [Candidatus Omnitrophica bacterium]|nr:MMPL family transporter [Candidatus Omnitrophota bacterium]
MFANQLSRIYNLVQVRKPWVIVLLGLVILSSIAGLKFIKYNNDIAVMLPSDKNVQRSLRFLREANFSDKLVVSLKLNEDKRTTEELILATDQFTQSINSPLIKQVFGNISGKNVMSEMVTFLKYTPQLLGIEPLMKLEYGTRPDEIKERLKFIFKQSLSPSSSFMMPFLRIDPLNLSSGILHNMEKLSAASGYQVLINSGHFLSRDGRHAMVIVKSSVVLTDGFGSRKIVDYLKNKIKELPGYVKADIIAGHLHTISNEDVIKKDIRITSIIAAFSFLLLFLLFFRDIRAVIIFLMPFVAVLIAINISFLVFKDLSYFVIGMGTVIAGIAIDYGIYVYMAVRKLGNSLQTVKQIIRPVLFGALTTISVFAAFFFSSVKGYRELAFLSNLSIILCLLFAIFILPHFLAGKSSPNLTEKDDTLPKAHHSKSIDLVFVILWLLVVVISCILGSRLKFNNDINQFDGTAKEIIKSEEEFHRVWGSKDLPAIFVVTAKSLERAYELNDLVYVDALEGIGKDNFTSFSSVWPGMQARKTSLAVWDGFWTKEKKAGFKKMLVLYGKPYNFSAGAFSPFIDELEQVNHLELEPNNLTFFNQLKDQFVFNKPEGYQIISFFPDREEYITKLNVVSNKYPGTFLISRKNFSRDVSRAFTSELALLAFIAVFLTVALTFLLLKNMRLFLLAMVPIVTSLALIIGVLPLAGLSLNTPSIIAAMVIIGVVSDYGMFVVYYCKYKYKTGTYLAVTFAALTTLIGAGVLLFAKHPILFSIGVTLVTGVAAGYISSLLIIPPLYRLWRIDKENSYA